MSGALCSAARRGDVSEVRRLVSEHLVDLHALEVRYNSLCVLPT